jgi:hypothetical protein
MVALKPAPKTVKIRYAGVNGATPWVSLDYVEYSGGPPTGADLNTLAQSLGAGWGTTLAPLFGSQVKLNSVILTDIDSNTGNAGADGSVHSGTRAGTAPVPVSISLVFSYSIPLRFRGGHVRKYWPGPMQPDITGGNLWEATFLALARSAAANWHALYANGRLNNVPVVHVGVSYFSGHVARPVPLVLPISGAQVHPRVDSQRRRLGKELP